MNYVGTKGQNNDNSLAFFSSHVIVRVGDLYYDPSYGLGDPNDETKKIRNEADFQKAAIGGFFEFVYNPKSKKLPDSVKFKKSDDSTIEIKFVDPSALIVN